jgi:hypothetical protein
MAGSSKVSRIPLRADHGPLGSCGHFVGSVPTNALVFIEFGGEFYWMIGNPEINANTTPVRMRESR